MEATTVCMTGHRLWTPSADVSRLANRNSHFCSKCGEKTAAADNYCAGCGQSLLKLTKAEEDLSTMSPPQGSRQENQKIIRSSQAISLQLARIGKVLKRTFMPVLLAFAMMLVFSYILFSFVDASFDQFSERTVGYTPADIVDELSYELDANTEAFEIPKKFLGYTDVVMASHLLTPTYEAEGIANLGQERNKVNGELAIKGKSILLLLIPLIALFAAGIFYRKRNQEISLRLFLSGAIGIGLVYGIFLAIFSMFSGFHYEIKLVEADESVSLKMDAAYPLFFTWIKGFLFGAGFSFLGMLFSINYRHMTKQLARLMPFGEAVHQGFAAFVRGFAVMIVIMVIYLGMKIKDLQKSLEWMNIPFLDHLFEQSSSAVVFMGANLGSIIYSMLHFSPLTIEASGNGPGETGSITYHIWTGFSMEGAAEELDASELEFLFISNDIELWLKAAILVPVALLIFAGYRLAKTNQANIKSLAVFSAVYAVFVTVLASAASFSFEGSVKVFGEAPEGMSMSLTIGIFKAFIGGFILSLITGITGVYLYKFMPRRIK